LVLMAALSSTSPVQKAKVFSPCHDDCQTQYDSCVTNASTPGALQRCYEKYTYCFDRCPVE
jgi:hypothetical protein